MSAELGVSGRTLRTRLKGERKRAREQRAQVSGLNNGVDEVAQTEKVKTREGAYFGRGHADDRRGTQQ